MDAKDLRRVRKGKAIGAQRGLSDTINFLVDFVQNLRAGNGLQKTENGAHVVFDAVGNGREIPNQGGGGNANPLYLEPWACFNLVINKLSVTIRNCHCFGYKLITLKDTTLDIISGYTSYKIYLEVTRDKNGEFTAKITGNGVDIDSIDSTGVWDAPQVTYFPLYEFDTTTGTAIVKTDFVHTLNYGYFSKFSAIFQNTGDPIITDIGWNDKEGSLNTLGYARNGFWKPMTEKNPVQDSKIIFTAEDYEV